MPIFPTEIQKVRKAIETQVKRSDTVIASNEAIADMISGLHNTLSEAHGTLTSSFSMLGEGLQELCFYIDDGFRELSYKLDLQNNTLQAIKEILERPLDTQAKELRKRAEFAYLNGWMDEAEKDLLESEKKNYQDFIALHILGNIYYHHKKNYQKALEYYQKAAKYAAPQSKKNACKALLCASKIYKEIGKVEDAYKSARLAMNMLSDDTHNLYNYAAYAAMTRHTDESINCLRQAVLKDSIFLITADRDERFSNVKQEKEKLKRNLRDEQRQIVEQLRKKLTSLRKDFKSARDVAEEVRITDLSQYIKDLGSLDAGIDGIDRLYVNNSYFDLLKAERLANDIYKKGVEAYNRNIEDWVKVKNNSLNTLKSEEHLIENKTYSGWGWCVGILMVILFSQIDRQPVGYSVFLFLLAIGMGFFTSYIIKQIKLGAIRNEIENEKNPIARLSNLKK